MIEFVKKSQDQSIKEINNHLRDFSNQFKNIRTLLEIGDNKCSEYKKKYKNIYGEGNKYYLKKNIMENAIKYESIKLNNSEDIDINFNEKLFKKIIILKIVIIIRKIIILIKIKIMIIQKINLKIMKRKNFDRMKILEKKCPKQNLRKNKALSKV